MWSSFASGDSLGTKGPEQGEIIRDEEKSLGARITVEKDRKIAFLSYVQHLRLDGTYPVLCDGTGCLFRVREDESGLDRDHRIVGNPGYDNQQPTIEALEEFVRIYP